MRLVDVRHEQTAVFAAEATAKLLRRPGVAVLTAGPGVTNGVSAITTAHFNGSPVLVLGGRAPSGRWGAGSLQELDHPPLVATVTKHAGTVGDVADIPARVDRARLAAEPHRGPVFLDFALEALFSQATAELPNPDPPPAREPDPDALAGVARLLGGGRAAGAGARVRRLGRPGRGRGPALRRGAGPAGGGEWQGRGILAPGGDGAARHPGPLARLRGRRPGAVVAGAPLDFRLGYGSFGGRDGGPPARVVHLVDAPGQAAGHLELAGSVAGRPRPGP